ncbi:MAG TPA: DUF2339 domain-containing protein [Arenimonas sp.]|nr:DUF2339 domain-containing protein [Arenimonas sp.]
MIWVWGIVGALVGLWLASDRHLLGFALGLAVFALIGAHLRLRQRLQLAEESLRKLQARQLTAGAQAAAAAREAKPEPTPTEAETDAPAVEAAAPIAEPTDRESAAAPVFGDATAAASNDSSAAPPPLPPSPPARPRETAFEPDVFERGVAAVKRWFTEGNVPVKIGVLVLFAGVAAALRFAAAEGYLTLPIPLRLSLIAAAALVGLGLGWRERVRRPVFALSLQGGAIGVLLLTVFAAFRLYQLLPAGLAFAFVIVLVSGAALLAMLQKAMALGVLGFLGGYLAPVLLSTGSGNHVALFSYYAARNAAVLAISWRQHWRLLNLIGFFFTFGVGIAWGARSYGPELFWTVEPFLLLFFLFYVGIGLLYVLRQGEHRRPFLDGTLIFGTPLVVFPLQAYMLKDDAMPLAFSALAVAGLYLGLMLWLRRRHHERLLTEAYGALALGFVTLAIPIAFSAGTTASLWALEGAAVAWTGLRQQRRFPWLAGLALQPMAAVSYVLSEADRHGDPEWLLFNSTWLGAAMIGFAGMALALIHDRYKPIRALPALAMLWGLFWWVLAGILQVELSERLFDNYHADWLFAACYLASTLALAGILRRWLAWPRIGWGMATAMLLALPLLPWAGDEFVSVLATPSWPGWLALVAAWLLALQRNPEGPGRSVALAHALGLWLLALLATVELDEQIKGGDGWRFLALSAPLALLTLGLWRRPQWLAWPRAAAFETGYRPLWFGLAMPLLALVFVLGLFERGLAEPLPFLPLLNPLELGLIAIALLLWGWCRDRMPNLAAQPLLWSAAAFVFVSQSTLRAVHHWHGEPWSMGILDSGFAQASLTVVWSLLGVAGWIAGSRTRRRPLWLGGAVLMGAVLLKLIAVDRQYMGNIPGIVSFLAVGLLLVLVGYFAPSPPSDEESR